MNDVESFNCLGAKKVSQRKTAIMVDIIKHENRLSIIPSVLQEDYFSRTKFYLIKYHFSNIINAKGDPFDELFTCLFILLEA
jgi:hypothetical protein